MLLFGFNFGGGRGGSGGAFEGGIVKPARAIAQATAVDPTVSVLMPAVAPDPAIAAAVAIAPTILGNVVVSPAAAIATASAVDPTLQIVLSASLLFLHPASDRGAEDDDLITNDPAPRVLIDAPLGVEVGDTLNFYVDSVEQVADALVLTQDDLDGLTEIRFSDLGVDATYGLQVSITNGNGESPLSNTVSVVVDTSLGACSVELTAGGLTTDDTTPELTVTFAGGVENDVAVIERASDGFVLGSKTLDGTDEIAGTAAITTSELPEGANAIVAYVYGTASGSGAGTFTEAAEETLTVALDTFGYIDNAIDPSDLTTYTFSSLDFGAATAGRYIIVGIAARAVGAGRTLDSVTIGGVSATLIANSPVSDTNISSLAIANVPTGTTGDVVVTFNAAMGRCGIVWWRAPSLVSATPTDTGTSAADPATDTLTVAAGGFLVVVAFNNGTSTCTWSNVTERLPATQIESTIHYSAADVVSEAGGSVSPSGDWSSANGPTASFASWEQ
jgi:hypothetical protein